HPVTGSGRRLLGLAHLVLVPSLVRRPRTGRHDVRGARGSRRPSVVTVRLPRGHSTERGDTIGAYARSRRASDVAAVPRRRTRGADVRGSGGPDPAPVGAAQQ